MKNNTILINTINQLKEQIKLNELSDDGYYLSQRSKQDYQLLNQLEKMLHNKT